MKTKSILAASLLIAGAAFAETVTESHVVGVLPVSISGDQVILSIPWIESGTNADCVAVANLVKTAGLTNGDNLLWYDPSNKRFEAWQVNGNEWVPVSTVDKSLAITFVAAGETALKRGQAVILRRALASDTTIYIVGGEGSGVSKTPLRVDSGTQALFAPPEVTTVSDLKTYLGSHVSNPNVGDEVIITPNEKLILRSSGWKCYTTSNNWETFSTPATLPIGAGNGLIYVNKGSNDVTITF